VTNFRVSDAVRLNVGLGHCMGPFGDFIDQKVWLAVKGKVDPPGVGNCGRAGTLESSETLGISRGRRWLLRQDLNL